MNPHTNQPSAQKPMVNFNVEVSGSGQTKKTAEKFARKILREKPKKSALVIGLIGELGSGKTTFLQGFAKGLAIREKVLSPTFIIYRKIQIPKSKCQIKSKTQNQNFYFFYHFDCYRIENPKELLSLGFAEIISNPKNIVAIEWADKIKKILPTNTIWIKFEFIDEKTRKIHRVYK